MPKKWKITVFVIDETKLQKMEVRTANRRENLENIFFYGIIQRKIEQKTKSVILIIRIHNFPNVFHVLIKLML